MMAFRLPKPSEPCRRCGRLNCDEIQPGELERIAEMLRRAPTLPEEPDDGIEPLL